MLSEEQLKAAYNGCKEGGHIAALRAVAEAAVKDAVGGEAVAEVVKVHGSKTVFWEKSLPVGTKLYTRPQASAAVPEGTAEVLSDLLCLIDNNLKFGCVPMAYIRAKALYRFLAASQPEVKSS